ncbi:MAG: hypothetical protein U0L58_00195 [Ruminococcus sp.]|nr:hypothetical protein [Ruminococcus sp.]
MKNRKPIKLSAMLTAVLLLAAVIVPGAAFAEELPTKNENKNTVNTVSIESNNEIYSPENPVTEVEVGSEFTLTMPKSIPSYHEEGLLSGDDVYFYSWRLSGEYDVVQGSVDKFGDSFDRTLVIKPLSDVSVTAWFEYNTGFHFARVKTNSNIYVPEYSAAEVVLGGTFTFSVPKDIPGFIGWEFSGDYDVIEGNVDQDSSSDRTVVLKPRSGVDGFAWFDETGSGEAYTVSIESNDPIYTPEAPVTEVEAGSEFTLTMPKNIPSFHEEGLISGDDKYFYSWRLSGEYKVIRGSVDEFGDSFDRTLVIKPLSNVSVTACFENNTGFHFAYVETNSNDYVPECTQAEVGYGESFTFSVPKEVTGFIGWEFKGDYDVVCGEVDEGFSRNRTVILKPRSAVTGFARFAEYSADETIKVYVESNNKDYTPEPIVTEIKAGSTYTFIPPDDVGDAYFYEWWFSGDYEVVEGIVHNNGASYERKVVLRAFSDINAVMCFDWDNDDDFHLVHIQTNNSEYEPECWCAEVGVGEDFVFEVPDDLPGFIRWEFTGSDYEVVEGTVDENGSSSDRKVVLRMWMGVTGFARFSEDGSPEDVTTNEDQIGFGKNEESVGSDQAKSTATADQSGNAAATADQSGKAAATSDQTGKSGVITDKSGTSPKTGEPIQMLPCFIIAIAAYAAVIALVVKNQEQN